MWPSLLVMLKCTYISELFPHKTKNNTVLTLLEVRASSSCLLDTWLVGWLAPNVPDHAVLVGQWYLCRGPLRSCSGGVEGAWHFPPQVPVAADPRPLLPCQPEQINQRPWRQWEDWVECMKIKVIFNIKVWNCDLTLDGFLTHTHLQYAHFDVNHAEFDCT